MRWTPGGSSDDVEDRRDDTGGGGMRLGGIHIGIGGFIVLLLLSLVFHRNFFALLGGGTGAPMAVTQQDPETNRQQDEAERPLVEFVTFVLNDSQATWTKVLSSEGGQYRHAKLVLCPINN